LAILFSDLMMILLALFILSSPGHAQNTATTLFITCPIRGTVIAGNIITNTSTTLFRSLPNVSLITNNQKQIFFISNTTLFSSLKDGTDRTVFCTLKTGSDFTVSLLFATEDHVFWAIKNVLYIQPLDTPCVNGVVKSTLDMISPIVGLAASDPSQLLLLNQSSVSFNASGGLVTIYNFNPHTTAIRPLSGYLVGGLTFGSYPIVVFTVNPLGTAGFVLQTSLQSSFFYGPFNGLKFGWQSNVSPNQAIVAGNVFEDVLYSIDDPSQTTSKNVYREWIISAFNATTTIGGFAIDICDYGVCN